MKRTIRSIVKAGDLCGLVDFVRDSWGLTLNDHQSRSIMKQASMVGGSELSPWSESTWAMWLKGKATELPKADDPLFAEATPTTELEAELKGCSDVVLTTRDFQFCDFSNANDLLCDHSEDEWRELLPVTEGFEDVLKEQFAVRGGNDLLRRAPLASWLFARLTFLGAGATEEENDLGGFGVYYVVRSATSVVCVVLIDADSDRVEVFLEGKSADIVRRVSDQFFGLLLQNVSEVSRCEIKIRAAEMRCTNVYGWNGTQYLGAANASA